MLELSDEWQVSKLPTAAAPSGHRNNQWCARAQLGTKISEKMADDMVARGTHSAELSRSGWGREGLAKVCLTDDGAELLGKWPLMGSGISLSNVLHRAISSIGRAALQPGKVLAGVADHLGVEVAAAHIVAQEERLLQDGTSAAEWIEQHGARR